MRKLLFISLSVLFTLNLQARVRSKCSLRKSISPKCYHKRDDATLKVALISYGSNIKESDLDRIGKILEVRFAKATNDLVRVEIVNKTEMDFKHALPTDYVQDNIKDPERLHRIWYYDNVGAKIMQEVYEEYKTIATDDLMDELDAMLIITGAQFNGLGFATGRVSVTESPREIAWGLPDGGRVEYPTDYEIVDELIHELGHNMFLGHASSQCQKPGMTYEEKKLCCENSEAKNDVMSYCRGRAVVDETKMYGFESCNLGMIENLVVPAMLEGKRWNVRGRVSCR